MATPAARPPALPMPPRWAFLVALLAYLGLVFTLSHTSTPWLPSGILRIPDKVLHFLEYVPVGFLWAGAIRGSPGRAFALAWLAAALFGLSDEIHQAFVPRRHPSGLDWLADVAGGGLGAALWAAWPRPGRRHRTAGRHPPG